MLCGDYGLFLEIAQVIKHLELTILRGVLETRSHELWAHFIVEVLSLFLSLSPEVRIGRGWVDSVVSEIGLFDQQGSRGFHRMDILWPLMQLLQRHRGPIASPFWRQDGQVNGVRTSS